MVLYVGFMTLFGTLELEWLCHASIWISSWWFMHLTIVVWSHGYGFGLGIEVNVNCDVWVVICYIIVARFVSLYWPKGCWNENDIKGDLSVLYACVWDFMFYSPPF